jgi:RES domain-containing protein
MLKAQGRWNRAEQYGCLYLALSQAGALAERRKYAEEAALSGLPFGPHELVSIDLTVLKGALDLTDPSVQRRFGVTTVYQEVPPTNCQLNVGPDRLPIP